MLALRTGEGQLNARRELASTKTNRKTGPRLQSLPPALTPYALSPGRVQTPACSSIKNWCLHREQEQTPTGASTRYTRIPRITELAHSPARYLARLQRLCAGLGGLTPQVLLCTPDGLMTSCLRSGLAVPIMWGPSSWLQSCLHLSW